MKNRKTYSLALVFVAVFVGQIFAEDPEITIYRGFGETRTLTGEYAWEYIEECGRPEVNTCTAEEVIDCCFGNDWSARVLGVLDSHLRLSSFLYRSFPKWPLLEWRWHGSPCGR